MQTNAHKLNIIKQSSKFLNLELQITNLLLIAPQNTDVNVVNNYDETLQSLLEKAKTQNSTEPEKVAIINNLLQMVAETKPKSDMKTRETAWEEEPMKKAIRDHSNNT